MKLSNRKKSGAYDRFGYYQGSYKSFKIQIHEGGDGWIGKLEHYWISFSSVKYDRVYNSLWENRKFQSIEQAKEFAIEWIDRHINEIKSK